MDHLTPWGHGYFFTDRTFSANNARPGELHAQFYVAQPCRVRCLPELFPSCRRTPDPRPEQSSTEELARACLGEEREREPHRPGEPEGLGRRDVVLPGRARRDP